MRRTAREIFEHVENNAHEELRRSPHALAFSGFAGGLSMGLTGLSVAATLSVLADTPARQFLAYLDTGATCATQRHPNSTFSLLPDKTVLYCCNSLLCSPAGCSQTKASPRGESRRGTTTSS